MTGRRYTAAFEPGFPDMTEEDWKKLEQSHREKVEKWEREKADFRRQQQMEWDEEDREFRERERKMRQKSRREVGLASEIVRIATMMLSDEVVDPMAVAEKFTADIARELMRYRKSHGLVSIRQNYKGTGSQRAARQLWVRLNDGAVDVWLNPRSYSIGGVTQMRLPGEFAYGTKNPAEIAKEIAEKINVAFNAKVASEIVRIAKTLIAESSLDGLRKPQAARKVNEIMSRHTKGFFTDEYWQPVDAIFKDFAKEGIDYSLEKASYSQDPDGTPTSKTWKFTVYFNNQIQLPSRMYGTITASGCASVQSPLDRYDVVAYCS